MKGKTGAGVEVDVAAREESAEEEGVEREVEAGDQQLLFWTAGTKTTTPTTTSLLLLLLLTQHKHRIHTHIQIQAHSHS